MWVSPCNYSIIKKTPIIINKAAIPKTPRHGMGSLIKAHPVILKDPRSFSSRCVSLFPHARLLPPAVLHPVDRDYTRNLP